MLVRSRRIALAGMIVAAAMGLTACAAPAPPPTSPPPSPGTTSSPRPTPSPPPTPTPRPPELHADGTATDNLPYFQLVLDNYVGAYGHGERALMVQHLAAAGFDSAMIEAGWVTTPNGLRETSTEVAVRFGGACLIGTIRDEYATATVLPLLSTGRCLIGDGFDDPA